MILIFYSARYIFAYLGKLHIPSDRVFPVGFNVHQRSINNDVNENNMCDDDDDGDKVVIFHILVRLQQVNYSFDEAIYAIIICISCYNSNRMRAMAALIIKE